MGVVAGAADLGVVAGAADSGVVAGAADLGVVAGAADLGVVAGAVLTIYLIGWMLYVGEFSNHFVCRRCFGLNEFGLIKMCAVHLIDQPACIIETLIRDQRAVYVSVRASLREFVEKPTEAIGTGVPGFYLFFGDLH